jgi:hypothetical protein
VDQEVIFNDCGKTEEEFVTEDDGHVLVVRRVCFTPWKAEGDNGQ